MEVEGIPRHKNVSDEEGVQVEAGVPTEELWCVHDGDFLLSCQKWFDAPRSDPQGSARAWCRSLK